MLQKQIDKKFLSPSEVAEYLHISKYTVYELVRSNKIPFSRPTGAVNGKVIFDIDNINEWMSKRSNCAQ